MSVNVVTEEKGEVFFWTSTVMGGAVFRFSNELQLTNDCSLTGLSDG